MADVYLARFTGPDDFEKLVAIKRIHAHLSEELDFIKMFVDEARLAARLNHPNVAQVIELGAVGKSHFIAMEYVDGESLTALIRRSQPSLEICARIVSHAAAGLHAAHELRGTDRVLLNVVHRDVSPQNILISYDGTIKVVDFGVARARGNLHTTSAGMVKGKFAYMAPEQARLAEVDRRADIFALGIVLYEITTRHRLFKAPSDAETVAKVLRSEIVPPSHLIPGYPMRLESILLKALARDPNARYQTAEELQEALETFIFESDTPVLPNTLAKLMRQVFADRIEQKRELLVRCQAQREEQTVPDAEMGTSPSLSMGGRTVSQAQAEIESERRRRRATWVAGAIAVTFAVLGSAGVWLWSGGNHRSATDVSESKAVAPRADSAVNPNSVAPTRSEKTSGPTKVFGELHDASLDDSGSSDGATLGARTDGGSKGGSALRLQRTTGSTQKSLVDRVRVRRKRRQSKKPTRTRSVPKSKQKKVPTRPGSKSRDALFKNPYAE